MWPWKRSSTRVSEPKKSAAVIQLDETIDPEQHAMMMAEAGEAMTSQEKRAWTRIRRDNRVHPEFNSEFRSMRRRGSYTPWHQHYATVAEKRASLIDAGLRPGAERFGDDFSPDEEHRQHRSHRPADFMLKSGIMGRIRAYLFDRSRDPVPLWRAYIANIEAQFGAGIASYFVFTRSMYLLNVFTFAITFFFIMVPRLSEYEYPSQCRLATGADGSCDDADTWISPFEGKGSMGLTPIFWSGYWVQSDTYQMDLAYAWANLVVIVGLLFYFVRHAVSEGLGSSLFRHDAEYPLGAIVFTTFDHSVRSDKVLKVTQHGIKNTLTDVLAHYMLKRSEGGHGVLFQILGAEGASPRHVQALAWFIFFVVISSVAYGLVLLTEWDVENNADSSSATSLVLPMVLTVVNTGLPALFNFITSTFEMYKMAETELHVMVTRSFIIRLVSMFAVLVGVFRQTDITSSQLPVLPSDDAALTANPLQPDLCAGTVVGQLMYNLLVVDIIVSLIVEFAYYYVANHKAQDEGGADFDLPFCIMSGTYRQGFVWFGTPFCPFLPFIGAVGAMASFFEYYILVRIFCRPPRRRTAMMQTKFFVGCAGLTLVATLAPLLYLLRNYDPNCGIYRAPKYKSFFDGLTGGESEDENGQGGWFQRVFADVLILYVFITLQLIWAYVQRKKRQRYKRRTRTLQAEVIKLRSELPKRAASEPSRAAPFAPAGGLPSPANNTAI